MFNSLNRLLRSRWCGLVFCSAIAFDGTALVAQTTIPEDVEQKTIPPEVIEQPRDSEEVPLGYQRQLRIEEERRLYREQQVEQAAEQRQQLQQRQNDFRQRQIERAESQRQRLQQSQDDFRQRQDRLLQRNINNRRF